MDTDDDLQTRSDGSDPSATSRPSERPSRILAAIATVLAVVSVLAVWVKTQALDTDEWVNLSSELLDEDEVTDTLAAYLVDQLYERIDVSLDLGERLPESLEGVATTLVTALRGPVTDGVERLIESDRFAEIWATANRTAHATFVAIIRDETPPGLSTADGEVAIELRELLIGVGQALGFSGDRLEALPDDAGRIVIFESDELDAVQQGVKLMDFLSWFLFALVIALYAASVVVARERLDALRRVGLSLVGVGVFVLLARTIAVNRVVESLVSDPANEPLAGVIAANLTSLVRQMAWSAVIWGALIALFAALLGDHRRAVWIRSRSAPLFEASTSAIAGGTVLFLLFLLWWDPGRAFAGVLRALVTVVLVVGAVLALRRQVHLDQLAGGGDPVDHDSDADGATEETADATATA